MCRNGHRAFFRSPHAGWQRAAIGAWVVLPLFAFAQAPDGEVPQPAARQADASSPGNDAARPVATRATIRQTLVIVQGAEGEPQFGELFTSWAERWRTAGEQAEAEVRWIGPGAESRAAQANPAVEASDSPDKRPAADTAPTDREALQAVLRAATDSDDTLWLVLIGHGTFDGRVAKFNLRGPDMAATELAEWLKPLARPQVIINCASSSSPFLNALSGPQRVVMTATRSGHERNFARFGEFLSAAIADPAGDLDRDGQTSVLEAYLQAADRVAAFYADQSRLATEHPLLDDNGDGLGTPADWFRGTRAVKTAKAGATPDGIRANQISLVRSALERQLSPELRQRRDELEFRLATLRTTKATAEEAVYYQQLEAIVRQLAEIYALSAEAP
ncbi:MAG: hypothetical protein AB7F89_11005 [Pirellulaceae bacterium]